MNLRPVIVFDVNETLLDLESVRPTLDRILGDPAALRLWFAAQRDTRDQPCRAGGLLERELFDALLDISKLDVGVLATNPVAYPINRLLERLGATFAGAASAKGLALRIVPCGAWVRTDPILLEFAAGVWLGDAAGAAVGIVGVTLAGDVPAPGAVADAART